MRISRHSHPLIFVGLLGGLATAVILVGGMALVELIQSEAFSLAGVIGASLLNTTGAFPWIIGALTVAAYAIASSLLYAWLFKRIGMVNLAMGLYWGGLHWLVTGVILGLLPTARIEALGLVAPGYFALGAGTSVASWFLLLHALSAAAITGLYLRESKRQPSKTEPERLERQSDRKAA